MGGGCVVTTSFWMPEHGYGTRLMLEFFLSGVGFGQQHMAVSETEVTNTLRYAREVWPPCVLGIDAQYVSLGVIATLDLIEQPREVEGTKGHALQICQQTTVNLESTRGLSWSNQYFAHLGKQHRNGRVALCGDYINRSVRFPLFESLQQAMGKNHVANSLIAYNQRSAAHIANSNMLVAVAALTQVAVCVRAAAWRRRPGLAARRGDRAGAQEDEGLRDQGLVFALNILAVFLAVIDAMPAQAIHN